MRGKWLNPIKTYWELEPFTHILKDPFEFGLKYFLVIALLGGLIAWWLIDLIVFLTLIYILVELTKMILR